MCALPRRPWISRASPVRRGARDVEWLAALDAAQTAPTPRKQPPTVDDDDVPLSAEAVAAATTSTATACSAALAVADVKQMSERSFVHAALQLQLASPSEMLASPELRLVARTLWEVRTQRLAALAAPVPGSPRVPRGPVAGADGRSASGPPLRLRAATRRTATLTA